MLIIGGIKVSNDKYKKFDAHLKSKFATYKTNGQVVSVCVKNERGEKEYYMGKVTQAMNLGFYYSLSIGNKSIKTDRIISLSTIID